MDPNDQGNGDQGQSDLPGSDQGVGTPMDQPASGPQEPPQPEPSGEEGAPEVSPPPPVEGQPQPESSLGGVSEEPGQENHQ